MTLQMLAGSCRLGLIFVKRARCRAPIHSSQCIKFPLSGRREQPRDATILPMSLSAANPADPAVKTRFSLVSVDFLSERVSLLYRLCGEDTPIILLTGALAAFALWGVVKVSLLLAWALWLCGASFARYALAHAYKRRRPPPEQAGRWENIFCAVSAALGAGWGITLMVVTSEARSMQELTIAFLISSISMGLPPSLAPSPKAFVSFVIPILAPVVALMFSLGGDINTTAAFLLLLFAGVLITLYLAAHRALMTTLGYSRENAALLEKLLSAEKSVSAALREQETVFETASIGLALVADGKISRCNGRFAEIVGTGRGALAGHTLRMFFDSDAAFEEEAKQTLPRLAQGETIRREFGFVRTDGAKLWLASESRAVTPAHPADGIIVSLSDITQLKLAEADLFSALRDEKELSEMKSKFVSIASHELRTPLTNILSSAELLEHYSAKLSEQDRGSLLKSIQEAVHRMTALINDVLIIGKTGTGKLRFNPVPLDVAQLLTGIVNSLRMSEGRNQTLDMDCALERPLRRIDEQLVRHVFTNLVTNALKYSPAESTVTVRVTEDGDRLRMEVTDRGIGIPEQDLPKMFESFHRASNVGDRPGTGLGLAIVKTAAELHGGKVEVTSRVGHGSTFTATLRAEQA